MPGDPDCYALPFRVRYDECGPDGVLRAAVVLRYLQEVAFAHSAALGFTLDWYRTHRRFWLVRRLVLAVEAPARYGDALVGTTQVVGGRRMLARRRNALRRAADGASVAVAVVDWIFTADGAAPVRVPPDLMAAFPALARPITPLRLPEAAPPDAAAWTARRVRVGDLDAMGHANHAVYVELMDDALWRAGAGALLADHPRTYEVHFEEGARADESLREAAWRSDDGWHYRLESVAGALRVRGRLRPGGRCADPRLPADGA